MARKKKVEVKADNPSENWVISESIMVNGRHVEAGTEVSIKDERGRFKFVRHVYNPRLDVEWVDVVGGPKGTRQQRSFRQDKIKRVHYKSKMPLTIKEIKQAKLEE
jgi:hypothetical protein